MFDYYAHKRNMEELAKNNEVRRTQLQAQQEREGKRETFRGRETTRGEET